MPKFLKNTFIAEIEFKKERGFPIFYMLFVFLAFMSIDVLYRYFNNGILFDPDIIHILFIDLTLALILMVIIGILPNFLKKYAVVSVLVFFSTMAFLYLTLGFEGVVQSSVNDITVLRELTHRLADNYRHIYIVLFIPILLALVPCDG